MIDLVGYESINTIALSVSELSAYCSCIGGARLPSKLVLGAWVS